MKKLTLMLVFSFLVSSLALVSCNFNSKPNENGNENGNESENSSKVETVQYLKFKRNGAKALAVVEQDSSNGNVASARNAATDSMIQKILEDGSMESFIEVPEGYNLARVKYIAQSSNPNAKEIYIVMEGRTWGGYWDEEKGEWVECNLGELLCVFDDGTYDDVLNEGPGEWKELYNGGNNQSIVFDKNGTMYYLVHEWNNSMQTGMIYKYDSKTKESIQLTPAVAGTYYEKIQVSADGKWIFAKAYKWGRNSSTQYLRAIPVDNPKDYKNIFYNANGSGSWIRDWYYDDDNNALFYSKDSELYSLYEKNGTFDSSNEQTMFSGGNGVYFHYGNVMDYDYKWVKVIRNYINLSYYPYNAADYCVKDANGKIIPEELCKALLDYAVFELPNLSVPAEKNKYEYGRENYHISFKKFANVPGYEVLATETEGLIDTEAFEAIKEKDLEIVLAKLMSDARYDSSYRYNWHENNFIADILYTKDENDELVPVDKELFSLETHTVNGVDVKKYASSGSDWRLTEETNTTTFTWRSEFLVDNDGVKEVDPKAVLDYFARYCTTDDIDFKLTCFKDKPGYEGLYTEVINEEAIKFLDDPVIMKLLANYLDNNWKDGIGQAWFFKETCFIAGTDQTAYEEPEITTGNTSIWWGGIENFTSGSGKSVYGLQSGNGASLVEILDKEGEKSGKLLEPLSGLKVSATVGSDTGFYFKVSLTNVRGEELGKHQLYYFNTDTNEVKNLFANVEDKENLEIISFSAGGDYLYFCAVQGLSVISEKINIKDLSVTKLASGQKLSQIMTMN